MLGSRLGNGLLAHLVLLVEYRWLNLPELDNNHWKHLYIIVPRKNSSQLKQFYIVNELNAKITAAIHTKITTCEATARPNASASKRGFLAMAFNALRWSEEIEGVVDNSATDRMKMALCSTFRQWCIICVHSKPNQLSYYFRSTVTKIDAPCINICIHLSNNLWTLNQTENERVWVKRLKAPAVFALSDDVAE